MVTYIKHFTEISKILFNFEATLIKIYYLTIFFYLFIICKGILKLHRINLKRIKTFIKFKFKFYYTIFNAEHF